MDQNDFEQKMINPDVRRTRIRRFWGSVIFLVITLVFIVFYSIFITSAFESFGNVDTSNEQLPGAGAIVMFFAAAAIAYTLIIASIITMILSFLGAFFGLTSIKYLPTKKMKVWARIVAYTNLAICAASFAYFMFCWLA